MYALIRRMNFTDNDILMYTIYGCCPQLKFNRGKGVDVWGEMGIEMSWYDFISIWFSHFLSMFYFLGLFLSLFLCHWWYSHAFQEWIYMYSPPYLNLLRLKRISFVYRWKIHIISINNLIFCRLANYKQNVCLQTAKAPCACGVPVVCLCSYFITNHQEQERQMFSITRNSTDYNFEKKTIKWHVPAFTQFLG